MHFNLMVMVREAWESESENSSDTMEMSEDTDQLIIASLENENKIFRDLMKLFMIKDKEQTQRIKDLQNLIIKSKGNDITAKILEFL